MRQRIASIQDDPPRQPRLEAFEAQALEELRADRADVALLFTPGAAGQPGRAQVIDAISDPTTSSVTGAAIRSVVDGANLALTGAPPAIRLESRSARVDRPTYFQFLGPGIIGMGLMTFATISLAGSRACWPGRG